MPDIRQYARESLEQEIEFDTVFADAPAPEPLENEVIPPSAAPPMEPLPPSAAAAALEPQIPPELQEFFLPVETPERSPSESLESPTRPATQGFDLPLGVTADRDLEILPIPERKRTPESLLPMGERKASEPGTPMEMMREQRKYSELSIRDFLAEHEWDELPLPDAWKGNYEPFPLPERHRTPNEPLDIRLPVSSRREPLEPAEDEGAGVFGEIPFEAAEEFRVTLPEVREEIQRDQLYRSMGQE